MNQFMTGLLVVLGLGCWWLYSENQTLKANNIKLEYAVEEQKQTIERIFRDILQTQFRCSCTKEAWPNRN